MKRHRVQAARLDPFKILDPINPSSTYYREVYTDFYNVALKSEDQRGRCRRQAERRVDYKELYSRDSLHTNFSLTSQQLSQECSSHCHQCHRNLERMYLITTYYFGIFSFPFLKSSPETIPCHPSGLNMTLHNSLKHNELSRRGQLSNKYMLWNSIYVKHNTGKTHFYYQKSEKKKSHHQKKNLNSLSPQ